MPYAWFVVFLFDGFFHAISPQFLYLQLRLLGSVAGAVRVKSLLLDGAEFAKKKTDILLVVYIQDSR